MRFSAVWDDNRTSYVAINVDQIAAVMHEGRQVKLIMIGSPEPIIINFPEIAKAYAYAVSIITNATEG